MTHSQEKYSVGDKTYNYNYESIQYTQLEIINYTDEEFMDNLPRILHFACLMSYVKNLSIKDTLSDTGIIHELVHLLNEGTRSYVDLDSLRDNFNYLFGTIPKKPDIQST